jgi:hypothetical protein
MAFLSGFCSSAGATTSPSTGRSRTRCWRFPHHAGDGGREPRRFLGRAVRFLVAQGISQFLDIGAGLPTQDNVHQIARRTAADARVLYVDHDPAVIEMTTIPAEPAAALRHHARRPDRPPQTIMNCRTTLPGPASETTV